MRLIKAKAIAIACSVVWFGLCLVPDGRPDPPAPPPSERRITYYPGACPDDQSWYLWDSSDTSVTVACYDPDYQEPDPEPSDDSTEPSINNALETARR